MEKKTFSLFESVILPILIAVGVNIAQIVLRLLGLLDEIMPDVFYIVAVSALSCLVVVLVKWTKTANSAVYQWIYKLSVAAMYCVIIAFSLLTIFLIVGPSEEQKVIYPKIDVALFFAGVAIIIPIRVWKGQECQSTNAIQIFDSTTAEYSVTGTCIPFEYDKGQKKIRTYLIFNEAYDADKWMFPGGHAFSADDVFPTSIAVLKAKEEAGLEVKILDLYHSYDISPIKEQEYAEYFSLLDPPHYTYLFKLSPNVRCYNKRGHRYHYDVVYVAKIESVLSNVAKFERVPIELPVSELTMQQLHDIITTGIDRYVRRKPRREQQKYFSFGTYVEKMLFEAHKDYVTYLQREGGELN